MTSRQNPEVLIARDEIVAAPVARACEDQSFELPGGLYAAMVILFAGFIAVLGLGFSGGHMAVAYGVIFAFLAAFFAIPAMFQQKQGLSWSMFRYKGVETPSGRTSAAEATVLVLLLPFVVLCFGIAVVTIAALA